MKNNLLPYKIGLAVIGLFVLGLTIFVIMQANSTKQDAQTDKKANEIANKLNSYINTHQQVPDSLAGAGIKDVPSTITYQKLGTANDYKFCVTYKNKSSGFDATSAVFGAASGTSVDTSSDTSDYSSYTKYSLYIDPTHHKGANCQTIKPLIYQPYTPASNCNYDDAYIGSSNCPTTSPTIYNSPTTSTSAVPSASTKSVCAYGTTSTLACKQECTLPVTVATPRIVDAKVTKVSSTGGFSMTVKDSKGPVHVIKLSAAGTVFDSTCSISKTSAVLVGDRVRIITTNNNGIRTENSADNFTATEIVDFSN